MSIASSFTDLADSIRYLTGTSEELTVADMYDVLLSFMVNNTTNGTPGIWKGHSQTTYEVPAGTKRIADNCPCVDWHVALTSVTLPSSLEYIGNRAFYLSPIQSLSIPASVREIGEFVTNRTALTALTFSADNKLTYIHQHAFDGASISTLNIPLSTSTATGLTIGSYAFNKCKQLQTVQIAITSKNVEVGEYAFAHNTALTSVTAIGSPSNMDVKQAAFLGCSALETVSPVLLRNASGDQAFAYTGLTHVTLTTPEFITNIGQNVFQGCPNLKYAVLTSFVPADKSIPAGMFMDCISLDSVGYLDDDIIRINTNAFKNTLLNDIPVSPTSKLSYIGVYAFQGTKISDLSRLGELNNLYLIDVGAFANCTELRMVVLPESVEVSRDAFLGCNNVSFYYNGNTAPTGFPWGATNSTIERIQQ